MAMGAAAPYLISAGGLIGSKLFGNSAQKSAAKLSPQEAGYYASAGKSADAQSQLAGTLRSQGSDLFKTGMPAIQKSLGYYSTLLGGNRAASMQAVAPETQQLTDLYGGAGRDLDRSGIRGASRDQARADLSREKTGRIAGLIGAVRPGAAAQLAGTGMSTVGAGVQSLAGASGAEGSAGGIYGGLIHGAAENRTNAQTAGNNASGSVGALVADLLKNNASKNKGGG